MSDPTTPPREPDGTDSESPEELPGTESGPIDVNELLESTRKLFEPEDIQRAMAQGGYTPEPSVDVSGEEPGLVDDHDEDNADQAVHDHESASDKPEAHPVLDVEKVEPSVETQDAEVASEASANGRPEEPEQDVVNEALDTDAGEEDPALQGVNVLSIVAFVLAIALSPLAVLFGYIALGQTRRARQRGETLALWAIGLGWLVLAAWVVATASLIWIGWQQGITLDSLREFIELFSLP